MGFLGGSVVKNRLPMQEMWVQSLCQKYSLEEEMATHSGILAWEIPWTEEPGRTPTVHGVTIVERELATKQYQQRVCIFEFLTECLLLKLLHFLGYKSFQ